MIIPVFPSQVWSTQRFLEVVHAASKESLRADTHPTAREHTETEAALRRSVSRGATRIVLRHSFSEGLAVFELEPSGKARQELTALADAMYVWQAAAHDILGDSRCTSSDSF
ncbi:hypothetical protein RIEGSTA812A_PEG_1094 [invertebrate metagenome]|uniref:Uncharacterized protein n=1 Tax=invertebrate metagenome TaxID=1711999 RepID=A0A484H7T8_9ZZZZ